ncbi:MAG: hypothetical protein ACOC6C_06060, partial [Verrucomicrobiota bacterium]
MSGRQALSARNVFSTFLICGAIHTGMGAPGISNEWRDIPLAEDWEARHSPPPEDRYGHQYSRNALDAENSRFYTMARDNIYRYDIRKNTWSRLPPGGSYRGTGLI